MTEMDTSRPAVEALIETVRNKYGAFDHFHRELADAAAALLDERDGLREDRQMQRESLHHAVERIRDLEATNRKISERSANHHDNAIKWRESAGRAQAKLDAVKAIVRGSYVISGEGRDKLLAILADTDEPKAGWVCSKCAREAVRGYDDGQIPEHHRTCSKRMPDTDEPKDSITFNTDDLGPATDIDGNPLADTDEGNEQ